MLELLAGGERRATELAAPFAVSRSAVAQHLRVMVSSGVVTQRRAGRERYYGCHREQLCEMDRWLRLLDDLCAQANNRRVGTAIGCAASITGVETPHPNRGIGGPCGHLRERDAEAQDRPTAQRRPSLPEIVSAPPKR